MYSENCVLKIDQSHIHELSYFNNEDDYMGSLEDGIDMDKYGKHLQLEGAPVCKKCQAYQCNRCIYLNKSRTREYNISPEVQCRKSNIERSISVVLYEKLKGLGMNLFYEVSKLDYQDPLEIAIDKSVNNPYNLFNYDK